MTVSEIIAKRIQSLCKERRIHPNKLGIMSGVPHSTLDSILHGRSKNPTLLTLMQLANAFSMTPAEFIDIPEIENYFLDGHPDKE